MTCAEIHAKYGRATVDGCLAALLFDENVPLPLARAVRRKEPALAAPSSVTLLT